MRSPLRIGILAAAIAACACAADNQLTPQETKAGWQLMFDGKTFAGWEDPTKKTPPGTNYTIEDGCLKSLRHPALTEDLFTTGTFTDFEMEFDWKISHGGNSGVKYRIQDRVMLGPDPAAKKFEDIVNFALQNRHTERLAKGQEYVVGFEYQCLDNDNHPDGKRGQSHRTGALYDIFAPASEPMKPVGEFNHSRLVVKGDHIEHWLNGIKVVDASLKDPQVRAASAKRWGADSPVTTMLADQPKKACQISLQNHGDEAWFKNLKIRKL